MFYKGLSKQKSIDSLRKASDDYWVAYYADSDDDSWRKYSAETEKKYKKKFPAYIKTELLVLSI